MCVSGCGDDVCMLFNPGPGILMAFKVHISHKHKSVCDGVQPRSISSLPKPFCIVAVRFLTAHAHTHTHTHSRTRAHTHTHMQPPPAQAASLFGLNWMMGEGRVLCTILVLLQVSGVCVYMCVRVLCVCIYVCVCVLCRAAFCAQYLSYFK